MIKVKCTNAAEANQSRSKHKGNHYLENDFTYKAQELGNYLYMIWLGKIYQGVFNRSNFIVKSDKVAS